MSNADHGKRLANDPILVAVRVIGFPEDGDTPVKNRGYSDNSPFAGFWMAR